jgi:hypothetical protein
MLQITVPAVELYDEKNNRFVYLKERTLQLEHSLVSVSKWESKWCKPFISKTDKTDEEVNDYIKCMTITQNVDPDVYQRLSKENYDEIQKYISAPMTATTFKEGRGGRRSNEIVTAEIVYYWMVSHNIPLSCEKWHFNKLLTLIRVCNEKNAPSKKMSKSEIMKSNAALNAARRQQLNSKG